MNVITSAPMFVNRNAASVGPSELYYGDDGSVTKLPLPTTMTIPTAIRGAEPSAAEVKKRREKGQVWDKAKGGWTKVQGSGILSSITNLLAGQPQVYEDQTYNQPMPDPNVKQPMSTGTKVLIGLGVAAVIGGIWYMATKGNKGK